MFFLYRPIQKLDRQCKQRNGLAMDCIDIEGILGPLGKLKVVTNETGGVVITRDGHVIVPHCIHGLHGDLTKFIFKQCITSSFARGDGMLALLLVASHVTSALLESVNLHCQPMQSRIRHLRAIEALMRITKFEVTNITTYLVAAGIWRLETDSRRRIHTLCGSMVVPAANVDVCERVISIMDRWAQQHDCAEVAATCVANQVLVAASMFDVLVHKSVGTRSPSSSDPVLQLVSETDLLIRGKCRNYGATAQKGASGLAVLFIKELFLETGKSVEHCIQLTTASDISSATRSYTHQLERLVQLLNEAENNGPFIVLCSCKVEDQALHLLSNAGVTLIDSVPAEYLNYGRRRADCTLFENIAEFIQEQGRVLQPGCISGGGRGSFVERLVLGSSNEVHYLIRGITVVAKLDSCGQQAPTEHLPQQLILHGNSAMSVGVYVSMLRRSLKVVVASTSARVLATESSEVPGAINVEEVLVPHAINFQEVLVPGAGAGELAWALLWSHVAAYLSRCDTSEIRKMSTDNVSRDSAPAVLCADTDEDLHVVLAPLVRSLGDKIAFHLARTCATTLPECVAVCEMLSAAYERVPLTLLSNARDVLPQSLHSCAGIHDTRGLHRVLLLWKQRLQSAGSGRGRIGLVVNTSLDAEEMCSLEDSVGRGVACSGNQFWSGFAEVLELARLQLRVSGQDGVIRVQSKRKVRGKDPSPDSSDCDDSSS